MYNEIFDRGIDRIGTNCEKWDNLNSVFGTKDVMPFWVADMDFPSPKEVQEALAHRAHHSAYGYTGMNSKEYEAVINWVANRHNLKIEKDWLLFSAGVVNSQGMAIRALTEPGDSIVIQTPVYTPFYNIVVEHKRKLTENPLIKTQSGWEMDFVSLENAFKSGAKMMLLCSPHNPLGIVWSKSTLEKLVSLAKAYQVWIVSDEIHSDFIYSPNVHTPLLSFNDYDRLIMLFSTTKTFNLAGLKISSMIVPNSHARRLIAAEMHACGCGGGNNVFGQIAQQAAYEHCAPWLDSLLPYLKGNIDFVNNSLKCISPYIIPNEPQGTYLMWLDCRGLGLSQPELVDFFIKKAGLGLTDGQVFGEAGKGFMRFNVACPRNYLSKGIDQLISAVKANYESVR